MNKPVKLHLLTIIIRCVFSEDGKFYPQYNTKKLLMMKELITVKIQILQDIVMFVSFGFLKTKNFNYEDYTCNGCHNLLTMAFSLDNIAVLNVGDVFYWCILMGISKDEVLKRSNNANNNWSN